MANKESFSDLDLVVVYEGAGVIDNCFMPYTHRRPFLSPGVHRKMGQRGSREKIGFNNDVSGVFVVPCCLWRDVNLVPRM